MYNKSKFLFSSFAFVIEAFATLDASILTEPFYLGRINYSSFPEKEEERIKS